MLQPDLTYQLLRNLTSPVVAITSERQGKKNDMISETGRFGLHLLHTQQCDVVRRLGFFSGRDQDKLAGIPHHKGKTGVPVLDECFAHFECSVANVMDTGSSTLFLGDVVAVGDLEPRGELLTATHFRANMPAAWRTEYEAKLKEAQQVAAEMSRQIKQIVWKSKNNDPGTPKDPGA